MISMVLDNVIILTATPLANLISYLKSKY